MDLNKFIQSETEDYIQSDDFKNEVKSNVKKMINGQIEDAFRSYGDISKVVSEYIKKEVSIDLNDLPASGIVDIMIETMNNELEIILKNDLKQKVIERVASITKPMPKVITFMEILDLIHEERNTYGECHDEGSERSLSDKLEYSELDNFMAIFVENDRDDYYTIHIDDDSDTKKDRCEYRIGVRKDSGSIVFYNGASDSRTLRTVNSFYGASSVLYKLQVQNTKLDVESLESFVSNYL
jgi:hypothetical protein